MIDYQKTIYVTVSVYPCEWFLFRHTQRWMDQTQVDRWQFGPFVVERTVEGILR